MSDSSPHKAVTTYAILAVLSASIAGLYAGALINPFPEFRTLKPDNSTRLSPSNLPDLPTPADSKEQVLAAIAMPQTRPELAGLNLNYSLPNQNIQAGITTIPAIYIPAMPAEIGSLSVGERKQIFTQIMLPLILRANQLIAQDRHLLSKADVSALEALAKAYRVKTENLAPEQIKAELEQRIRPIPVSLALAQAAIESGWGTSRFTQEANALFGQWAWRAEDGLKPKEASNSRAVIKRFDTLQDSVISYMKNLNSHWAYQDLRDARAAIYAAGDVPSGLQLAPYMSSYAETGDEYIETISQLITRNQFTRFEDVQLAVQLEK